MADISTMVTMALLSILLVATSYAAFEYFRQLKKTQKEYVKAREIVEDIILSFNRELKRKSEKIEEISYKVEDTVTKAEAGLRKEKTFEKRLLPLEGFVDQLGLQLNEISSVVRSIEEANGDLMKRLSTTDFTLIQKKLSYIEGAGQKISEFDSKLGNVESSQENLSKRIGALEEQLKKSQLSTEFRGEIPLPVLPIRRDKAMAALTDTEIHVLEFLTSSGPKTAPEIREKVQLSREHTSRLMKKLYEEGYLERETGKLPFTYSVKKEMKKLLGKPENTQS